MTSSPPTAPPARSILAAALVVAALLAGCSGASSPSTTAASGAGQQEGFDGAALPPGVSAPDFMLTDQQGRRISLSSYRGQVVILTFLYPTCGGACILVAEQIRGALDGLARPVPVLVLSVEPAADEPIRVARFLARVSLAGRAEYLSGSPTELRPLWLAYHITPPSLGRAAFARAASVLLIDRNGRERVVFGLEQLTPEALAHDIGKLQKG
jgi:protein SCO1/2